MTSPNAADRLWALLPSLYRLRDAEQHGVLRELVDVLAAQVDVLDEELNQLYDDQFIETCAPWVVPYIGDLIGYRMLHGVGTAVRSPRAEVANTIGYRRRKGTAAMLESLAFDVTDWPARVIESFERLTTTQYMNHIRSQAVAAISMRRGAEAAHQLDWIAPMAGAFDDFAHTADVRRIGVLPPGIAGRYNIKNVAIFLWRTESVPLERTPLMRHAADPQRFRFDSLGADCRLFAAQPTRDVARDHLAQPSDVPLPLPRRWTAEHLTSYYGLGASLHLEIGVKVGGAWQYTEIPPEQIRICDLSDVPGGTDWANQPLPPPAGTPRVVAVDPVLGRVYVTPAFGAAEKPVASWHYGAAVPVGARGAARPAPGDTRPTPAVDVGDGGPLQATLTGLATGGVLRVVDSDRYPQSLTVSATTAAAGDPDTHVWLQAADRARPLIAAANGVRLAMQPRTTVVLDGLLVADGPVILEESDDGEARTVVLRDCTLVPGQSRTANGDPAQPTRASLFVLDPFAVVQLERCIVGPVIAVDGATVTMTDCIVDAGDAAAVAYCGRPALPGGAHRTVPDAAAQEIGQGLEPGAQLSLAQCTVVGCIHTVALDASNSLLLAELPDGDPRAAAVWARRKQLGCVRFSYLPVDSRVGHRYRCQPDPNDLPGVQLATRPYFTSSRFGDPAYAQLRRETSRAIRSGGDNESEMGVTNFLLSPQREADLLVRLDEYLRFGLEAGIFYAT